MLQQREVAHLSTTLRVYPRSTHWRGIRYSCSKRTRGTESPSEPSTTGLAGQRARVFIHLGIVDDPLFCAGARAGTRVPSELGLGVTASSDAVVKPREPPSSAHGRAAPSFSYVESRFGAQDTMDAPRRSIRVLRGRPTLARRPRRVTSAATQFVPSTTFTCQESEMPPSLGVYMETARHGMALITPGASARMR